MLSSRCSQILEELLKHSSEVTIKDLSDKFAISSRTVRYDLDKIDEYLKCNHYNKLIRKSSKGISVDLSHDDIRDILISINKLDDYNYVLSQKQRVKYMIYTLLQSSDYVTINSLIENLFISKATANNNLKLVKQWLEQNHVEYEATKFKGIRITADEIKIRKASARILSEGLQLMDEADIKMGSILKNIDIKFIMNAIKIAEEQMNIELSDYLLDNLVIHIAIAIVRIKNCKDIVMAKEELSHLIKTPEFAAASGIAKMIEDKFSISVPDSEIGYITIHLLGSNPLKDPEKSDEDYIYYEMITTNLINRVQKKEKKCNFNSDTQLFDSLIEHIRPMIYRLKKAIMISNPLLDDIKIKYGETFNIVRESVSFLEKELKCSISDDEIGYLTIHFMVSIQKFENMSIRKARVLVVCATGIGTSKFVSMKLKSIFDIDIIDTISTNKCAEYLNDNRDIDLIISTVPMHFNSIRCITVSPFLNEKNISELSLFLSQFKSSVKENNEKGDNKENVNIDAEALMCIIKKSCTVNDYDTLVRDISNLLSGCSDKKLSFWELLDSNCISLNVEADCWQDAIRTAGNLLKDYGYVKESYVDSMIDNVNKYGNYILIADDVAMPHAKAAEGAVKTGFSLVTLKNAVYLGDKKDSPVDVIIAMSAVDKQKHVHALHELIDIVEDKNTIERIKNVSEIIELQGILQN